VYFQDQTWLNKLSTFKIFTKCIRQILILQMTNLLLLIIFKLALLKFKVNPDLQTKGSWVFQTKVLFQVSKQVLKTQWCNSNKKTNLFQISHSYLRWIRHMEAKCKATLDLTINNLFILNNNIIHLEDSNKHRFQVLLKLKLLHLIFHSHHLGKLSNSNK